MHFEQKHFEQMHLKQMHFGQMHFEQMHFEQMHFEQMYFEQMHFEQITDMLTSYDCKAVSARDRSRSISLKCSTEPPKFRTDQGCQMVHIFSNQKSHFCVNFGRPMKYKMLEYFMAIWNTLQIFHGHCGNLMVIWYIFLRFSKLNQEKSGNPGTDFLTRFRACVDAA
jgi:hypothetical protein